MLEMGQGGHRGGLQGQEQLIHLLETLEVSNRVRAELGGASSFPGLTWHHHGKFALVAPCAGGSLADGLGNTSS